MNKDNKIYGESLAYTSDAQALFALAFEEGQNQFKKKVLSALNKKKEIAEKNIIKGGEAFLIFGAGILEAIETVEEL